MEKVLICGAVRTPIGSYLGGFKNIPAYKLGATVLDEAIKKAGISPEDVDEVIMGQSYQNGESVNIARVALLAAGWPVEIPGITIDRRCCSGLDSICFGAMKIQCGYADVIVAGGVESMSQAEFYIPGEFIKSGTGGRFDQKLGFMPKGHGAMSMWGMPVYDRIQRARVMSQPIERFGELNSMMSWAEAAAKHEDITREAADNWSLRSHKRACAAIESGKFKEEIVPVSIPSKKENIIIDTDEPPRPTTTIEKLRNLKTVYEDGVCTAGNSSTENDGAAAVVLISKNKAKQMGIKTVAQLESFSVAAADPTLTYPAVPASVTKALKRAGLTIDQMNLIEIQEAFAVQVLADAKLMGINEKVLEDKVNVNGSGISLGHPIAATGTMRMVGLIHELYRRNGVYGLETICGGGGHGIAAVISRPRT